MIDTKSFCIITGGSRGIGRAIAVALSTKFSSESVVVITGRSAADLSDTRLEVQAVAPGVEVRAVPADLGNVDALKQGVISELFKDVDPASFQNILLINNAGSLGGVSRFLRELDTSDISSLQEYYTLNLTSALLLTSHLLTAFPKRDGLRRTIVNISSLAAIQPMSSCGVYCMGKAARDMLFKTIAVEDPDVRILNYAPGPVDTAMNQEICDTSADQPLREMMSGLRTSNNILQPHQTASKLARILEDDTYESGAHVDYYDIPE